MNNFKNVETSMEEKQWSVAEIVEELRNWEDMFYSESETKWLMNKAADIIENKCVKC